MTNLRSLQNFVPNLTFAPSQNVGEAAANVFIRGIGQEDFGVGAEGGVAFYVDGVYLPRSLGMIMNLTDVERIEVLRGPQGTLYGKDAIGGAINVISTLPGADRERRANVILGNYRRPNCEQWSTNRCPTGCSCGSRSALVNRDGYLRRLAPLGSARRWSSRRTAGASTSPRGRRPRPGRPAATALAGHRYADGDLSVDGSRKRDRQGAIHVDLIVPDFGDVGPTSTT